MTAETTITALEILRFVAGAILCLGGIFVTVTGVIGNFKFRYVLSRMHAAGLGDTMGLLLLMIGLIVLYGFGAFAIKLLVIVIIFWTASPVASHMIMKMEIENGSGAKGPEDGRTDPVKAAYTKEPDHEKPDITKITKIPEGGRHI